MDALLSLFDVSLSLSLFLAPQILLDKERKKERKKERRPPFSSSWSPSSSSSRSLQQSFIIK
jgi:type IV secretory pathway VirD2 relaxase